MDQIFNSVKLVLTSWCLFSHQPVQGAKGAGNTRGSTFVSLPILCYPEYIYQELKDELL